MTSKPVVILVLVTELPMLVKRKSKQTALNDKPELMSLPINYLSYLTTKLSATYLTYTRIKTAQLTKDLDKRLEVIYESVEELKSKESKWNEEEKEFHARRLDTYRSEIKAMKEVRDSDSQEARRLTRAILELWKEIRDVRNRQGYTNTGHKIVIKKVKTLTI